MAFFESLFHFLFPSKKNDHKAGMLHSSSLVLLAVFLIGYQLLFQLLPYSGIRVFGYAANISPDEVIRLTNQKRAENGLPALVYNGALADAARRKADNMLALDYWAHVAPDGTQPWKFFSDAGYKYKYAGENLARDFSNPSSAVDAWMASPSHKSNLLSDKYKEIGIAVIEGDLAGADTTLIVQLFGTRLVDTVPSTPIAQAKVATPTPRPPTATPRPTIALEEEIPTTPVEAEVASPTPTEGVSPFVALVTPGTPEEGTPLETTLTARGTNLGVLISPFQTTKGVSVVTTTILLTVMIIDWAIVSRRKVPRIGGRTFAHLAFMGMILSILLVAKAGEIL